MKTIGSTLLVLLLLAPPLFAQRDTTALKAAQNLKRFMTFYLESIKHRAMENPDLALNALNTAERIQDLNDEQRAAIAYEQGKNYAVLTDYNRAIAAYKQAQAHTDFNFAAQTNLYDIYHRQGAYQEALGVVKRLSEVDEDYCVDLIKLHIETGALDRAQVILDSITDAWGTTDELQTISLELQTRLSKNKDRTAGSGFSQADYNRYMTLLQDQALDEAIVLLEGLVSAQNLEPNIKAQAIEAFAAQSPDQQYHEAFDRLIPKLETAEHPGIEVALGRYFLDRLDIQSAQKHGKRAIALNSNHKEALLLMASIDYARASFASGLEYAEMALALYPADPWCYLLVARGYRYSGMLDLAEIQILSGLEFTLAGSSQYRRLCLEASAIYKELGRQREAESWLEKAEQ